MSAWVLPDHIADVLPAEARHLEESRRGVIDVAGTYGYELVMPPLLEHLDSLLTGVGRTLDLQTFKVVDQLSGKMLGLRADTTQQVARIDAHLLNRPGVTRLCYCGPILHVRPNHPYATREPLQFGAEIYGCAGVEADVEALSLMMDCLHAVHVTNLHVDLGDARIARAILKRAQADAAMSERVHSALCSKDRAALDALTQVFPDECRTGLRELLSLYGDASVLDRAAVALAAFPELQEVLFELRLLASHVKGASVSFDLADLGGYSYYSSACFAVYTDSAGTAVARGGRYDEVGAVFGRNRPAVGFSLDLRMLVGAVKAPAMRRAVRAPWPSFTGDAASSDGTALQDTIKTLRASGETVVCVSDAANVHESGEFFYDRRLVLRDKRWTMEDL
jgi:ATP phosphoribosyltransferase regulatory subunit